METRRQATIRGDRGTSGHTVWQVKVSTFCNLRCRYCYEWDRLDDRTRISLGQWRTILEAISEHRDKRFRSTGLSSRPFIVWHGGEPTLLPHDYVFEVLALQREILGFAQGDGVAPVNVVQTNLYRSGQTLDLMAAFGFLVSVSLDFAPGARVTRGGRETEQRVLANLENLIDRGVTCGVVLVLGRHNHRDLPDIYDLLERMGVGWMRIVPMFDPPTDAPAGDLALSTEETVRALGELLVHRLRRGGQMAVSPLDRVRDTVDRHLRGEPVRPRDRRRFGDSRFVVHPDGKISSQAGTATPNQVLGNIFDENISEILGSKAYRQTLEHDDKLRARHCTQCTYQDACDGRPLFDHPQALTAGPCPVESQLCGIAMDRISGREKRFADPV